MIIGKFENFTLRTTLMLSALALAANVATVAADDYQDPAGLFTLLVPEHWEQVASEASRTTYQLPNNLTMHILTLDTDDVGIAEQSALQLVDIDPAGLTSVDAITFSGWNITFYVQVDDTGVTPMCQVNASVSHCLVLIGDANLARNPPGPVMTAIQSFALAGAQVALPVTVPAFEAMIANIIGETPPGMSVVIGVGGDVIYSKGFGLADGPAILPAEEDTVFMWASMTKMITATAVMQLVDQGLIGLDVPVSEYLDYLPAEHGITIRHLLSHSSGLGDSQELIIANVSLKGQPIRDADKITREYFEQIPELKHEPGATSAYSTPGILTLGQVVAQVSGMSYADYVREHILSPLDMNRTDFFYSSDAMLTNLATPAIAASDKDALVAEINASNNENSGEAFFREVDGTYAWMNTYRVFGAGSGLIGPATEAIRFVMAHTNSGEIDGVRILSAESTIAMQEMQLGNNGDALGWGLGWHVNDSVEHTFVEHDGGGPGMFTKMRIYPESGVSIVMMSNAGGWNMSEVADGAANVVFKMMTPETASASEVAEAITEIPPVLDASGNEVPGSLASLEKVTLGGVDQWILIRAQDTTKPVLLILHGGPGGATMPWVDMFQPTALEENFVVVHWDQRGAGKSFDPDLTADDLQAEDFVADTFELTDLLRERFDQKKIFLHGHSWGSALGFLVIAENSDPFHAYIAAGERVNWVESHNNSFEWVKAQATTANDTEFLKKLEEIGSFEATNRAHLEVVYEGQDVFRGGDIYTEGHWDQMLDYVMSGQSPYYTMTELNYYIPGVEKSGDAIADFAYAYDLPSIITSATIPVHFMVGEHDHNTAADLSGAYYETFEAPAKSFTVIEGAGHSFLYEKPDEWSAVLIKIANEALAN